ncbi:MAG: hypothetical protein HZA49_04600 [Planctomycetes bacterium]|nr:hypothetical protein [Planctomycetota bacterium]
MPKKQIVLAWGKIRRMFLVYLRPNKTRVALSVREGECRRCGACCAIMFKCPALKGDNGTLHCKIYDLRSNVCKTFPINPKDIKDRDLIMPHKKCGFHFNGHHH